MRVFITGGSGVLGRALVPLLTDDGHDVYAPGHDELELFSERDVRAAVEGSDVVYHLATRIPPTDRVADPDAWVENDRLRAEVTGVLVDAALAGDTHTFVLPSVAFLYPADGPADEDTPVVQPPGRLSSMMVSEEAVQRFADAGRRGVILRLGLLWGPYTGNDERNDRRGATLHSLDAGSALRVALDVPSGIYNVVGDGERISNQRFKSTTGWKPTY